jgi:hypothetical protein
MSLYIKQVQLNLELKAYIHNTTEAYYKCTFPDGLCSLSILFPNGNVAVLTSPSTEQVRLVFFLITFIVKYLFLIQ